MTFTQASPDIHPVILEHLARQGLVVEKDLEAFLYPTLSALPSPFLFKSMREAVQLILAAIKTKSEIVVWGDYDVDGITSTALLILFFRQVGVAVKYHIPDRLTEGYGLNSSKLAELAGSKGSEKVLITVDCGIANHEEIRRAREIGFTVIVTDHHQVPAELNPAQAVINPRQKGCDFPFKDLAGVGVAFYLAAAMRSEMLKINYDFPGGLKPNMKSFLGLVALGTIADVMPLHGVNRLLTKGGFEALSAHSESGLGILLEELGLDRNALNSEAISYRIAPVLNAAGRLGEPLVALDVLTGSETDSCKALAARLVTLNNKRKKIGKNDLETALNSIDIGLINRDKCIVIKGDFHDGLLGITASRLAEIHGVPAIVCCAYADDKTQMKGSARAPHGFNLFAAIRSCSPFLIKYGGHEVAAGVSLKKDLFQTFRDEFKKHVAVQLSDTRDNTPDLARELPKLSVSEALNPLLLKNLHRIEPVGEGNPKPMFIDTSARFVSLSFFGIRKEHVRGVIRGKYNNIPAIGFNMGQKAQTLDSSTTCSLVYSHMYDTFNKSGTWKIRIENIWQ